MIKNQNNERMKNKMIVCVVKMRKVEKMKEKKENKKRVRTTQNDYTHQK